MIRKLIRCNFKRVSIKLVPLPIIILFAVLVCFTVSPGLAIAHSPKAVTLSYDSASETLKVTITHTSKFTGTHYINKIEVMKNGAVILTKEYESQPTEDEFSYAYQIPVGAEDVIEVKASCNIFGSKTTKLTAGSGKESK